MADRHGHVTRPHYLAARDPKEPAMTEIDPVRFVLDILLPRRFRRHR
ncbi:hypothetical protein [uncultured Jannaschia sp.]|nr:hypothetical protein [uncultured Jannaschia sp.]